VRDAELAFALHLDLVGLVVLVDDVVAKAAVDISNSAGMPIKARSFVLMTSLPEK
jgi:hypothetical protein